jgi:hypothetical protein
MTKVVFLTSVALALAAFAFAGPAMANCGADHTAMSKSTVTAESNGQTPAKPSSQTPQTGG